MLRSVSGIHETDLDIRFIKKITKWMLRSVSGIHEMDLDIRLKKTKAK